MHLRARSISLVSRMMLAIFIAGLLPLLGMTLSAIHGYRAASDRAVVASTTALDTAALGPLQQRTEQTAQEIGDFLDVLADDVRAAALLPPQIAAYKQFIMTRDKPLWLVTGTRAAPVERHEQVPIFRELVALDGSGQLLARIVDGKAQSDPGDARNNSSYLADAKVLAPDALSVSHLSRLYVPRPADEGTRLPGADYVTFDGVYRFIAARRTADGAFDGAVMLALDARHIMEFVVHIVPTPNEHSAVWPDFASGDFASLIDNEGWTIAHPLLWTVRGNDANGQPVPAVSEEVSSAERDSHPVNVLRGADPARPGIFDKGRAGESGFIIADNRQGVRKATTYAPIPFDEGIYRDDGVFGVLMIESNTDEFHRSSAAVAAAIDNERGQLQFQIGLVGAAGLGLLILVGVAMSRMLVRPLANLTAVARRLEQGEFDETHLTAIRQRRFSDEVTILANVFAAMGRQVVQREQELRTQISDLHIQIDSRRRQQQVDEITETDYFRDLRDAATKIRARRPGQSANEASPAGLSPDADAPSSPSTEGETPTIGDLPRRS